MQRDGAASRALVGRQWEINTVTAISMRPSAAPGVWSMSWGRRASARADWCAKPAAIAAGRGVPVFTTFCESHASDIPFHAVARLLRAGFGVAFLDDGAARAHIRAQVPDADPEDLLLLDDLLGIRDAAVALPDIAPDARRRRLTALVNAVVAGAGDAGGVCR